LSPARKWLLGGFLLLASAGTLGAQIIYRAGSDGRLVAKRNPASAAYPYRDGLRLGLPPRGWTPQRWYLYDSTIQAASATYGLDPALVKAILWCESRFNPLAKSRAGAEGVGQLMPGTARRLGVRNPYDPQECIWGTAAHLRRTADAFHTMNMAVLASGYNAGDGAVQVKLLGLLHGRGGTLSPAAALSAVVEGGADLGAVVPNNRETPGYVRDVLWCWDRIHTGRR
jgi:soluble lytic murein transglycosylase-like protein